MRVSLANYCKGGKSQYGFLALAGGSIFCMFYLFGVTTEAVIYTILLLFSFLLALHDWKHYEVPNPMVAAMACFGVLLLPINPFTTVLWALTGAVAVGGGLILASLVTKGQIGMGDGTFFCALGLFLGLKSAFMILLYSLVVSALVGLVMIACRRAGRKTEIPFIPFVVLGILIEMVLKF